MSNELQVLELLNRRHVGPRVTARDLAESLKDVSAVRDEVDRITKAYEDTVLAKYLRDLSEFAPTLEVTEISKRIEARLKEIDDLNGDRFKQLDDSLTAVVATLTQVVSILDKPDANSELEREVLELLRGKLQ